MANGKGKKRGAGMTTDGRVPLFLRVPPELKREIEQLAHDENRDANGQAIHMLRDWISANTEAAT